MLSKNLLYIFNNQKFQMKAQNHPQILSYDEFGQQKQESVDAHHDLTDQDLSSQSCSYTQDYKVKGCSASKDFIQLNQMNKQQSYQKLIDFQENIAQLFTDFSSNNQLGRDNIQEEKNSQSTQEQKTEYLQNSQQDLSSLNIVNESQEMIPQVMPLPIEVKERANFLQIELSHSAESSNSKAKKGAAKETHKLVPNFNKRTQQKLQKLVQMQPNSKFNDTRIQIIKLLGKDEFESRKKAGDLYKSLDVYAQRYLGNYFRSSQLPKKCLEAGSNFKTKLAMIKYLSVVELWEPLQWELPAWK